MFGMSSRCDGTVDSPSDCENRGKSQGDENENESSSHDGRFPKPSFRQITCGGSSSPADAIILRNRKGESMQRFFIRHESDESVLRLADRPPRTSSGILEWLRDNVVIALLKFRGDKTPLELFLAGVRRQLDNENSFSQ